MDSKVVDPEGILAGLFSPKILHTKGLTKTSFSGKVVRFFPGDKRITDSYFMEEKCPR